MVVVQCDGFSCLGYRDDQGKWMSAFTNEELNHVARVLSY